MINMEKKDLEKEILKENAKNNLDRLCRLIAQQVKLKGFRTDWENMPEKLMLVVTEISEAMEEWRNDDKDKFAVEIADATIRIFDICGALGINLTNTIELKEAINFRRPMNHGRKR